jgi:hypothetical protein
MIGVAIGIKIVPLGGAVAVQIISINREKVRINFFITGIFGLTINQART